VLMAKKNAFMNLKVVSLDLEELLFPMDLD